MGKINEFSLDSKQPSRYVTHAMSKINLCPSCLSQIKAVASKGGLAGTRADKLRASRLGVIARAETALKLTHNGRTMPVVEWAKVTGIPKRTLWRRLRRSLPVEQVLAKHGAKFPHAV